MKRIVVRALSVFAVAGLLGVLGCGGDEVVGTSTDSTGGLPPTQLPKMEPMVPFGVKKKAEPKTATSPAETPKDAAPK
jgi:hypothetical protein